MPITSTKCHKVEPKCVCAESIPDSEKRNVVVLLYFLHLGPLVELRSLAELLQAQHLWRVIIYCNPDCLDSTSDLCTGQHLIENSNLVRSGFGLDWVEISFPRSGWVHFASLGNN